MVKHMDAEYQYAVADETELDAALSGQQMPGGTRWSQWSKPTRPPLGSVTVIWKESDRGESGIRPLVIVANDEDVRRLCGRYAQLHSDLSPLTAWCHLISPRYVESLDSLVRVPQLNQMEAAWTGLIVAEALLLAERPLATIKISACLATHSFAVARANALWSHIPTEEITKRFDSANRSLRSEVLTQKGEPRARRIRTTLEPVWDVLISMSQGRGLHNSGDFQPIVSALQGLAEARLTKDPQEARRMIRPLQDFVPESEPLAQLTDLSPESRLRLFDKFVDAQDDAAGGRDRVRRIALSFLAGYLATVAAGGAPSLSLTEVHVSRWPEITAWAFVAGGVGEKVLWTSSFDGLGRLVARELTRPLRLDEAPSCDFALDEAAVIVDPNLGDPLVHLKVKQARLLTVELLPGVNVAVPIVDSATTSVSKPDTSQPTRTQDSLTRDPIAAFADALWPRIRSRLDEYISAAKHDEQGTIDDQNAQRNRGKKKTGGQPNLPLGSSKRY